jgi:hypothetical protein
MTVGRRLDAARGREPAAMGPRLWWEAVRSSGQHSTHLSKADALDPIEHGAMGCGQAMVCGGYNDAASRRCTRGDERDAAIPVARRRGLSAMIPMRRFALLFL